MHILLHDLWALLWKAENEMDFISGTQLLRSSAPEQNFDITAAALNMRNSSWRKLKYIGCTYAYLHQRISGMCAWLCTLTLLTIPESTLQKVSLPSLSVVLPFLFVSSVLF